MEWIAEQFVPLMFTGLFVLLLTGFPVAFVLSAVGILFGLVGIWFEIFPSAILQAMPLRIVGIMQNETILAVPFFTFMGIVLEKSGIAEDLLETAGQVFGPLRGGLAISVVVVGALLAATTGVISAAVISMGLISLPVMLRYGYNRNMATGVIMASGSLAQIIPPSVVLIVLADQLGLSVGDMYAGAVLPGLLLVALYALFICLVALFRPAWVPALPPEARGEGGYRSLLVLCLVSATAALAFSLTVDRSFPALAGQDPGEAIVLSVAVGAVVALLLLGADRLLRLGLLSALAGRVTVMLVPPLVLIFLVLGTIFLGLATPTEGGAMGAIGALVLAGLRGRMNRIVLRNAVEHTATLTCFVIFILIGATVFSLVFNAADGHAWVENLFDGIPGGHIGFLVIVNVLVFFLGFFLDFFEIAFIVIPILAPIAEGMGIDLIWFAVLIAVNLQTSYLTPPFGFALFFLRNVAPRVDYTDSATGVLVRRVTTAQIYTGGIAFVILQIVMIAVLIAFPEIVTGGLQSGPVGDPATTVIEIEPDASIDDMGDPMRLFDD